KVFELDVAVHGHLVATVDVKADGRSVHRRFDVGDLADRYPSQQDVRINNEAIDVGHLHGDVAAIRRGPDPDAERSDIPNRHGDHRSECDESQTISYPHGAAPRILSTSATLPDSSRPSGPTIDVMFIAGFLACGRKKSVNSFRHAGHSSSNAHFDCWSAPVALASEFRSGASQ